MVACWHISSIILYELNSCGCNATPYYPVSFRQRYKCPILYVPNEYECCMVLLIFSFTPMLAICLLWDILVPFLSVNGRACGRQVLSWLIFLQSFFFVIAALYACCAGPWMAGGTLLQACRTSPVRLAHRIRTCWICQVLKNLCNLLLLMLSSQVLGRVVRGSRARKLSPDRNKTTFQSRKTRT